MVRQYICALIVFMSESDSLIFSKSDTLHCFFFNIVYFIELRLVLLLSSTSFLSEKILSKSVSFSSVAPFFYIN